MLFSDDIERYDLIFLQVVCDLNFLLSLTELSLFCDTMYKFY